MKSRADLLVFCVLVFLVSVCFAEDPRSAPAIETGSDKPNIVSFPFIAEISGTDVYVRSGHGTAYYFCSKVNSPDRVTVVDQKYGWSKIVPPPGSFSWISRNFVDLDTDNPDIGIVTGDSVRVYAGSPYREPMRSNMQTKLNEGDHVELMGLEKGDYYKIVPPTGAYLWVSSQYLKYIGPIPKPEPPVLPPKLKPLEKPIPQPIAAPQPVAVEPSQPRPEPVKPVAPPRPKVSAEVTRFKEYHKLVEQIDSELAKSIDKQGYKTIKDALKVIADDPKAGKAKNYAKYQLDRIARFELARKVEEEVTRQDAELAEIREQIRKSRSANLTKIPDPGQFIVVGELRESQIYTSQFGPKRYFMVDDTGKIVCYAEAAESAADIDTDKFINRKVGLTGEVASDVYSPISLVKFTEITELNLPAAR